MYQNQEQNTFKIDFGQSYKRFFNRSNMYNTTFPTQIVINMLKTVYTLWYYTLFPFKPTSLATDNTEIV